MIMSLESVGNKSTRGLRTFSINPNIHLNRTMIKTRGRTAANPPNKVVFMYFLI
jgi:hypothetical protein